MGSAARTPGALPLVLLRHGRSTGHVGDVFTGRLDVPLHRDGRREAVRAGRLLRVRGLRPDVVQTSSLQRAVRTTHLVVAAAGGGRMPVRSDRRLDERDYGSLQGRRRSAVRAEAGEELFRLWRRSFDVPPPGPGAESLADVRRRLEPCWREVIAPDLAAGRAALVVGHSASLRALCMLLDDLSPDEVAGLDLPTGVPLRYDLDADLRPLRRVGTWLDPAAAARGVAEVRAQGSHPTVPLPVPIPEDR